MYTLLSLIYSFHVEFNDRLTLSFNFLWFFPLKLIPRKLIIFHLNRSNSPLNGCFLGLNYLHFDISKTVNKENEQRVSTSLDNFGPPLDCDCPLRTGFGVALRFSEVGATFWDWAASACIYTRLLRQNEIQISNNKRIWKKKKEKQKIIRNECWKNSQSWLNDTNIFFI